MSEVDIFWTSTGLPCVMWDTTSSQQFCSHFSIRTHSEAEPNDHDLSIEERSKSNDNKQWYQQLVLTYFEFPELLKKKKKDEDENIIGKCLQCKKTYSGRLFSTSN